MEDSNTKSQKKKKNKTKKNNIPTVWFSLKKSLHCKSEPSDVHDPKSTTKQQHLSTISTKRNSGISSSGGAAVCGGGLSGCSRSIANLKDVIHGSKRHFEKPPISSPRSIGSNEFLNPITHEVILSNSTCELKITGVGDMASPAGAADSGGGGGGGGGGGNGRSTTYVGMLRPGTPMHYLNHSASYRSQTRKGSFALSERDRGGEGLVGFHSNRRVSLEMNRESPINGGNSSVSCHKCGEQFNKLEAAEAHHLSKHAGKYFKVRVFSIFTIEIMQFGFQNNKMFSTLGEKRSHLYLKIHNFAIIVS